MPQNWNYRNCTERGRYDDGLDDDFIEEEWQFVNDEDEEEDDNFGIKPPQPDWFVDEDDDEDDDYEDVDEEYEDEDYEDEEEDEEEEDENWSAGENANWKEDEDGPSYAEDFEDDNYFEE
jgi:hypothetical protein